MRSIFPKPWFRVTAVAEDEATSEFFVLIKFRDVDGDVRTATLPLADIDDRKVLTRTLKNSGAYFSTRQSENDAALAELLRSKKAGKRWKFAASVGWNDRLFVLHNRVLGSASSDVKIRPPRSGIAKHIAKPTSQGTSANWSGTVAATAASSSRMVFGISAAFAAPLLGMAGLNSFGVLVHGPSKSGKSTMLIAAASAIGYGHEQDLPNFRTTDAAFGELPTAFNDSLLPMNELGLLKGSTVERRQRMRDLTYGFAEGRGITYSTLAPIEKSKEPAKWQCILLATGEESFGQIASEAQEIRMAGESIRWIDLPATRKDDPDIFDRMPKSIPPTERATWFEEQCQIIRDGAQENHGRAIRSSIRYVIANRKAVRDDVHALQEEFVRQVSDASDAPPVRHLAKYFGHIYAGGILGVRSKFLPWSEKLVHRCVARCYHDARRELKLESDLIRDALAILKARVPTLPKISSGLKAAEGFRTGLMRDKVTVRADDFRKWFSDARQPSLLLHWLGHKGALPSRPTPAAKGGRAIVWAESQPTWPDGSRPRSIVIDVWPQLFSSAKSRCWLRGRHLASARLRRSPSGSRSALKERLR